MVNQINEYKGYKLTAPASFWLLPESVINSIAKGCGPGSGWKEKAIPDTILGVCITPACIIHDVEYYFGETFDDKDNADKNFLINMLSINEQDSKFFIMKWLRRRLIFDYYSAVSDLGNTAFGKVKMSDPCDNCELKPQGDHCISCRHYIIGYEYGDYVEEGCENCKNKRLKPIANSSFQCVQDIPCKKCSRNDSITDKYEALT